MLNLKYQTEPGGSFASFDLVAHGVHSIKLKFSDEHPATLSFSLKANQVTMPLGYRWFVIFWDDAGTTPDGSPQSDSNPAFEGHVWEIQPADSNTITYVIYDPTLIAGRETPVMSTAWLPSGGVGLAPIPDPTAVARAIYNNAIFNDVDYAFERAHDQTVGQIIALTLDDANYPLHWFNAAPSPVGTHPYINLELDQFDYIPQSKVVSTNESVRQFVDRLTQAHYPEYAFLWTPGTRLWHWYSRLTAPAETMTLNTTTTLASGTTTVVLGAEIHRSLEGRYPAVEFQGPETAGPVEEYSTLDGTLAPIGPFTQLEIFIDSGGIGTVDVYSQYQIVNPVKRRGAKLLPTLHLVRDDAYHWVGTHSPSFQFSFDLGETWRGCESIWFDFQNGIVNFPEGVFIYFWSDQLLELGSSRHFWTPNAYRLIWAPYSAPIKVRYPTTGWAGTSYTVAGQQSVYIQYDEMLAVGYNRVGIAVTTATRRAQYEKLAEAVHKSKKDIIYTGGMLLEGIIWDFCRLNKTINIAAVDADGVPLTTGWEAIAACITDVDYDFGENTTNITFSHSALVAWGDSLDLLKERLRIGVVELQRQITMWGEYSNFQSPYTRRNPISFVSGISYTDTDLYYDPRMGTTEAAL